MSTYSGDAQIVLVDKLNAGAGGFSTVVLYTVPVGAFGYVRGVVFDDANPAILTVGEYELLNGVGPYIEHSLIIPIDEGDTITLQSTSAAGLSAAKVFIEVYNKP